MKCIVVCGINGTGKTTRIRSILRNIKVENRFIYDPHRDYAGEGGVTTTIERFIYYADLKRNTAVVFEEATEALHSTDKNKRRLQKILVRRRQRNTLLVFVFHSILDISAFILRVCDYIYLHKVADEIAQVRRHVGPGKLLDAYMELQKSDNPYDVRLIAK